MRITGATKMDAMSFASSTSSLDRVVQQGSDTTVIMPTPNFEQILPFDSYEETKIKVKEAVGTMNEMLEANNSASKFVYHEGLESYYVTVVNKDTDEVVKEIPPKKLLDAFYEMKKMLGMIVDKKI